MVGAGMSAQGAANSLKNNSVRKERKNLFQKKDILKEKRRKKPRLIIAKKASPELLEKIKNDAVKERKAQLVKNLLIGILSIVAMGFVISFVSETFIARLSSIL